MNVIIPQGFNNQEIFTLLGCTLYEREVYIGKFKWIVVESVFILDPFYSSECNCEFIES